MSGCSCVAAFKKCKQSVHDIKVILAWFQKDKELNNLAKCNNSDSSNREKDWLRTVLRLLQANCYEQSGLIIVLFKLDAYFL